MKNYDLIVELGSSNTSIYKKDWGVVLKEPTLVAIESSKGKDEVIAVGEEAKKLIGKTNKNVDLVMPIVDGVVKNLSCARKMLEKFLTKVGEKNNFSRKNIIFSVPCGVNRKEQQDFKNLAYMLNAKNIELIPNVFFALAGMTIDNMTSPKIIVNMGGGVTDIAVISNCEIISGCTVAMGNRSLENKIIDEIINKYSIEISRKDAEDIKKEVSTLLPNDIIEYEVFGVDINTSETRAIKAHSQDFLNLFTEYYSSIVNAISAVIKSCSVEIRNDIVKGGILVCGGNATINGLERFLRGRLNLPIHIATDPKSATIIGINKVIKNPKLLNSIINNVIYWFLLLVVQLN